MILPAITFDMFDHSDLIVSDHYDQHAVHAFPLNAVHNNNTLTSIDEFLESNLVYFVGTDCVAQSSCFESNFDAQG